jgi:hypothetical protein
MTSATTAVAPSPNRKLSFTLAEAAEASGFTEAQLRERINAGELKAKRAARSKDDRTRGVGKFIVLVRDLEQFLADLPDA